MIGTDYTHGLISPYEIWTRLVKGSVVYKLIHNKTCKLTLNINKTKVMCFGSKHTTAQTKDIT